MIKRREFIAGGCISGLLVCVPRTGITALGAAAQNRPLLLPGQVKGVIEALRFVGEPIPQDMAQRLLNLAENLDDVNIAAIEEILDRYTLARVRLDQYGVGQAVAGEAHPQLAELGWRSFLVRVENPAKLTGPLILGCRVAIAEGDIQPGVHESHILGNDVPQTLSVPVDLDTDYERNMDQWMGYRFGSGAPTDKGLEGAPLEYQVLQLYCQTGGGKSAYMVVGSSKATYRLYDSVGFTSSFDCHAATTVTLDIRDVDGRGAMASLLIYDEAGRLYPAPAHRLEPDLGYQPQIYRAQGEAIRLPAGRYRVTAVRGPEYIESHQELVVAKGIDSTALSIQLERWIDATRFDWYPGDPHVHPEGQVYGAISKYGVTPETMLRQICGEGLCIGSVLIWAGGYYYEKQFLTGHTYEPRYELPFPEAQRKNNTALIPSPAPHNADSFVRYDVEQAAFPSNLMGHLVLLRLKNHDFPGVKSLYDWPSWNLPILKWSRTQGALAGYAHIGHGWSSHPHELPNYEIPPVFGLGANECLVDVTHGVVDFVAGCERSDIADLTPWYHLLNCGFRIPMIGETDFVALYARAGAGRTYVKLDSRPVGDAGYDAWLEGIKAGRVYFGDGRSHFIDLRAKDHPVGGPALELQRSGKVVLTASIACRLEPTPFDLDAQQRRDNSFTYWHIERARIGATRTVPLEVVVNGRVVERREIIADGELRSMKFTVDVSHSSWIALRVLPSGHTSPIFVSVAGKPVRVSRRSAQWCLDCIEALWEHLGKRIRESERTEAAAAWDHARVTYRQILSECAMD